MSERPRNVRVYMVTHRFVAFVGCFGVRNESRGQSQPSVDGELGHGKGSGRRRRHGLLPRVRSRFLRDTRPIKINIKYLI